MAGTIVVDRIESDASYASTINVAANLVLSGGITGNVNIDSGLLFVDAVNNKVGIGTQNPMAQYVLDVRGNMRLGDGISPEQDIEFYGNQGSVWQVGTNNSSPTSNNWWYVYTTGVGYALAIDGVGRISMPYQPRFHYTGGTTIGTDYTTVIPTGAVISSPHYSTSTGRFTAPINGTYHFGVWGLMYPAGSTNTWSAQFTKNGTLIGHYVQNGGSASNHAAVHSSTIVALSAGDWVDYRIANGGNGTNAYGSQWNQYGYLLG